MAVNDWQPRLVALDIDGTLLKWVEGVGTTYEQISPPVYAAVHRARAAGAHIVLASGRSPHGMTRIADLLDLHADGDEPLWVVASNGAVLFRYPPLEVVHEETFDAAPAVAAVLEHHPSALVAVEERGVGYRVNRPFPDGELSGEMVLAEVDDLVSLPVSRVIIRDPDATADDFVALAARLGLHGTDYVVGWTAWLDLSPVGVSKASGLAHVAGELGVDAADVLAIGDGRNDIEMLRWAGRGVAMGQAVDVVLDAADAVTASVHDEGAAVELDRWFPSGAASSAQGFGETRDERAAAGRDRPRRHAAALRRRDVAAHGLGAARCARPRRRGRVRHRASAAVDDGPVGLRRVARPGRRVQRRAPARRRDGPAARGPRHRAARWGCPWSTRSGRRSPAPSSRSRP